MYDVKWKGFEETTFEPRENVPRVLVELFETHGDSSLATTIKNNFEKSGIHYVTLSVEDHGDMILPSSSLQIDENAYFIPILNTIEEDCNTIKTKSGFYHRTGGILAMGRPCGYIVGLSEIFGGESIHQVAEMIEIFLESLSNPPDTKVIAYDDGRHLKRGVMNRSKQYPFLHTKEIKIDRFHYPNHTNSWCKREMNPNDSIHLKNVNTEVMEQTFAWLKGFAPSLKYMSRDHYLFVLLDVLDRHNNELIHS